MGTTDIQQIKILIVDDNAADRLLLKASLNKLGLKNVADAEDGQMGLRKLQMALEIKTPFSLLFLDRVMPKQDGLKVLRTLREDPTMRKLKIIMLSGHSEKDLVEETVVLRPDAFVVKPASLDLLKKKLLSIFPDLEIAEVKDPDKKP